MNRHALLPRHDQTRFILIDMARFKACGHHVAVHVAVADRRPRCYGFANAP